MLGLSKTQGWVALGGAAAVLVAFGLWLGRRTHETAGPAPRSAIADGVDGRTGRVHGRAGRMDGQMDGADGDAYGTSGRGDGAGGQIDGAYGRGDGVGGRMDGASGRLDGADGRSRGADGAAHRASRFHAAAPQPHGTAPGLASDVHDRDPRVRRAALAELVKSGDADPQLLIGASHDGDQGVAFTATEALGVAYADGRVPAAELVARVKDRGSDEKLRVAALDGLGVVATPETAALLVDLLAHGDVTERRSAAILLQHQDLEIAIPALANALGDADEWVRANALEALRRSARGRDFGMDADAWRAWWQARPR